MFIPLSDANKLKYIKLQWVTLGLIAANVLAFVFVNLALPVESTQALMTSLGYIPAIVHDHRELEAELVLVAEEMSFVTYAFLHADWMHIGSNMLFLWVFGDNVEDATGHVRFLVFYLLCGAAAAFAHGLMDTQSIAPLIGASGAVSGVIAAYLILHPKVWVWILAFGRIPLKLPAAVPILFWIGFQLFMVFAAGDADVSWAAHIGGFVAGLILIFIFKRRAVPLFDRVIETPSAVVLEAKSLENRPPELPDATLPPDRPWGR